MQIEPNGTGSLCLVAEEGEGLLLGLLLGLLQANKRVILVDGELDYSQCIKRGDLASVKVDARIIQVGPEEVYHADRT